MPMQPAEKRRIMTGRTQVALVALALALLLLLPTVLRAEPPARTAPNGRKS